MRRQAFVLLALLAACEGPPARSKPWRHAPDPTRSPVQAKEASPAAERLRERTAAEEKRQRTLRVRLDAEPAQLDPLVDPEVETLRVAEGMLLEPLVRYEPGDAGRIVPWLAESFRVADDGAELRFVLRAGVSFHDGKPFTAVDAQLSIDLARAATSRSPRLRRALADVAGVEMWGPRDLRLRLRRPNGYILRALAELPILPAHIYGEGDLARNPRNRSPVGTGPYRFVRWARGDRIVLERNDGYWGERPAISDVEYLVIPDGARALMLARQGGVDILPALVPEHWPAEATAPATVRELVPLRLRPAWLRFGAFQCRRPPFDDVRVRRAATLAVDRDKLARDVYRGLARPVAGPVWIGGPGDAPAATTPLYDAGLAAALLEAAGWRDDDGDGVRERDGQKLRASLLASPDARGDAERDLVIAGLRKVGFWVDARPADKAAVSARLADGDFDIALVEYRGRTDEDLAPLLGQAGALNPGHCGSSALDAALAAAAARWEPAARRPAVAEISRLMGEEQSMLPLVAPDPAGLVSRRLSGATVWDGWLDVTRLAIAAATSAPASPR